MYVVDYVIGYVQGFVDGVREAFKKRNLTIMYKHEDRKVVNTAVRYVGARHNIIVCRRDGEVQQMCICGLRPLKLVLLMSVISEETGRRSPQPSEIDWIHLDTVLIKVRPRESA